MSKLLKTECVCRHFKAWSSSVQKQRVVYSGIQPTGVPHVGNYLGAVKNWVNLQEKPGKNIYCVVDLHSITVPKHRDVTSSSITEMLACLLACGLDPSKSILYKQSDVMEHTQLSWVFGSLVKTKRLSRFPQWKEKKQLLGDIHGLYSYPILQAADILLYDTTHVPVGDDQAVHIHLTNEIAESFNSKFGETFNHVNILSEGECSRVLSLRDPTSKMSKSSKDQKSVIYLNDPDDVVLEKIKKSISDSRPGITYEPEHRPGVSNLVRIHSGFSGKSPQQICEESAGLMIGEYKMVVADVVIESLRPIRDEYLKLKDDQLYLDEVFARGKEQASEIASKKWSLVREAIGIARSTVRPTSRSVRVESN